MKEGKNKYQSRRDFVKSAGKLIVVVPLVIIPVALDKKDFSNRICLADRSF